MRRSVAALADSGPVVVLAAIAAAGSFTHIRDTATEHGQGGWMAWAVAVCIDLTCVMAARERQRDQRTGRRTARLSWPTGVLIGGILLSLAANLAQADPTVWGWITAGTPAAAFLVAVSMLERRTTGKAPSSSPAASSPAPSRFCPVPSESPAALSSAAPVSSRSSSERSGPSSPWVRWDETRNHTAPTVPHALPADLDQDERDDAETGGQTEIPVPVPASASSSASPSSAPSSSPAAELVEFARRVATEHHNAHGRPITRDALRARLGVSNQLASDLLRQLRTETAPA
ncbi:DUF2637 domain-containing protein [Spirillospora albida]|uniref:DUF2637 domain-containing protein n=1 Tax=Spirillospora albida TaxID=58123 RepID=UPI0005652EA0|nr:DUF2637 domain-containing protein [Spirillospora albida]